MLEKDSRIVIMDEILSGIKVQMNAFIEPFGFHLLQQYRFTCYSIPLKTSIRRSVSLYN